MYNPLFLGLTHIGQVFSLGWAKKVGRCSVYDFNLERLKNFELNNFTDQEISLKKFKNSKRIQIIKKDKIKHFKVIFFTVDTELNNVTGEPILENIERYYKELASINFKRKVKVFFTSQVPIGFTNKLKNKFFNSNIELIYLVDTLQMGSALNKFLHPPYLTFGCDNKLKKFLNNLFKKFKCKKYILNTEEAEYLKMSTNMYLFFNVSLANLLDHFSRKNNLSFSRITNIMKNDIRIGQKAYINPSIAISGGHLERDCFYFKQFSNYLEKNIINSLLNFNEKRKKDLLNEILMIKKKYKKLNLLIVGISYKKNSFSMVNSIFKYIFKSKKINSFYYDDFFSKRISKNIKRLHEINDLKKFDCVIFNYGNINIQKKIYKLNNNKKIKILNISDVPYKNFKIKKYFSPPAKHI